jgi:predicted ATPase/class 3 adenylate cyclase
MNHTDTLLKAARPTGTVTFLFTDVESSTNWWAADADAMSRSLRVHDSIMREVIVQHDGYTFSTAGDSFAAAFSRASSGVAAAIAIQTRLSDTDWPGPQLRVRIGLHIGEAEERDGDYFGSPVNTAARVEAAGHGGQIVISELVRAAVGVDVADVIDLGLHHLRGVPEPLRLFQLGDTPFPPLRVTDTLATNLPARPTRLLGREHDIAMARQSLRVSRLVTIAGVGGSGKTRLAIAIGEEELAHRPGGVWFVDLTSITNGEGIAGAVSAAMGLRLAGRNVFEALFTYLQDKKLLIIIDNCEHLIDACAEFAERFLRIRSESVLLATSRETLDIDGERTLTLGTLSANSVDSPAVQLFYDRASAIDPYFALNETNTDAVVTLCTRLDGLPLAIELAAARISVMTPQELLAGLDDRFRLLDGGRRRQRQRTLDATLAWSYELLDTQQQTLFRSLGVFVGGFDLEAVLALSGGSHRLQGTNTSDTTESVTSESVTSTVLGDQTTTDTRRLLEALVTKSLVVRAESYEQRSDDRPTGPARFVLLETVKAYAEKCLRSEGTYERLRHRHLSHYHQLVATQGRIMVPEVRLGARLKNDRGNLTAAFDWAVEQQDWIIAGELLLGSLSAYELHGAAREAKYLFDRCVGPIRLLDMELADYLTVAVLLSLALLDSWGQAREVAGEILDSNNPNCRVAGHGLLSLAMFPMDRSISNRHMESAENALLEVGWQANDLNSELARLWLALVKSNLAGYAHDLPQVRSYANELERFEERNHYVSFLSMRLSAMAAACSVMFGEPHEAIITVDRFRALAANETFGDDIRVFAHLAQGQLDPARELTRRHTKRGLEGRISREANDSLLLLSALAFSEGDHELARYLILRTGFCRHIAMTLLARHLADRLGIVEEHAASQLAAHSFSNDHPEGVLGATKAMNELRIELVRRGWLA